MTRRVINVEQGKRSVTKVDLLAVIAKKTAWAVFTKKHHRISVYPPGGLENNLLTWSSI